MKFSLSTFVFLALTAASSRAYIFDEKDWDWECNGGWSRHHTKISSAIKRSVRCVHPFYS
jgi:hypothetical protein